MSSSKSVANGSDNQSLFGEQKSKINEVRASLGSLSGKSALYCSDASIARYLIARNWNVKKAIKMLKDTLKWRTNYKPDEIKWDEVASEAETGKIYRSNFCDKLGRSVLVMRPGRENTKSTKGQIRYLVYCMENAILNLPAGQEQMAWLIDFGGFSLSKISLGVTKETADVLQGHYPERLGIAILYNPPKIFESFWTMVRPFLEPKTRHKVKFVYSDDPKTKGIMEELFNMDELDSAFGGNSQLSFNLDEYAERMRADDKRMPLFWSSENINSLSSAHPFVMNNNNQSVHSSNTGSNSESDDKEEENQEVINAKEGDLNNKSNVNGSNSESGPH